MTVLLDGNVLVALGDADHVHHDPVQRWFVQQVERCFATCPITQGTLLRHLMREGITDDISGAVEILNGFLAHPAHRFWADDMTYEEVGWRGVLGHRQITDAYLAGLARKHGGGLATLDNGLSILHQDVAQLIEIY